MLENVHCFSVKHCTNYLMNNLLPFSQAANHACSPKKLRLVASGTAVPTTHFCRVPFGLAMNCPYSLFLGRSSKKAQLSLSAFISRWQASLENSRGFLEPSQEQSKQQWMLPSRTDTTSGMQKPYGQGKTHTKSLWLFLGMNSGFSWEVILLHVSARLFSI